MLTLYFISLVFNNCSDLLDIKKEQKIVYRMVIESSLFHIPYYMCYYRNITKIVTKKFLCQNKNFHEFFINSSSYHR